MYRHVQSYLAAPRAYAIAAKKGLKRGPVSAVSWNVHHNYTIGAHQGSPIIGIGSPMVVVICRAAEALTVRRFCRWTMLTPQIADL